MSYHGYSIDKMYHLFNLFNKIIHLILIYLNFNYVFFIGLVL